MAELEERQAKIEGILEQLDKRLTRVESEVEGLRTEIGNLHAMVDSKIGALNAKIDSEVGSLRAEISNLNVKIDSRIGALDAKIDSEVGSLRTEISNLHAKIDSNFRWQMGVMFTMWVTIILAVLVKG